MRDMKFRIKTMIGCLGAWIATSFWLIIIAALADIDAWFAFIAIFLPGSIFVPWGLYKISMHEKKLDVEPAQSGPQTSADVEMEAPESEGGILTDPSNEIMDVHLFRDSPIPNETDGHFDAHSQDFLTEEDATHFASVFTHNYFTPAVVKKRQNGKFFVECKNAEWRLLRTDFIENPNVGLIENIKNPYRGPKKAREYFSTKKPKLKRKNTEMKKIMLALISVLLVFGGVFGFVWQLLKIDFKTLDFGEFNIKLFLVFVLMMVVGGKLIKYGQNNIQAEISDMTGAEFENHIANLLRRKGHSIKITPKSGDYGVDIVMDGCTAIQCKRYGKNVGVKAVQEVYAGMQHYGCTNAIVVTNSYFTPNAVTLAGELGVSLWDKDTIRRMM